jgi:hypothetical protein
MEWLILIFVVPLILVPIVLLCGFAGCSSFGTSEDSVPPTSTPATPTKTTAPTNFTATAKGTDKIDLEWQHASPTAKFTVRRTAPDPIVLAPATPADSLLDSGLNDGTDIYYDLTAKDGIADPSDPIGAQATTKPNAPTNLVALPEDPTHIVLTWNHVTKSTKNISFKISDTLKTGLGGTTEIAPAGTKDPTDPTLYTYSHTVDMGSEHEYRVTAVVDGFDNGVAQKVMSDPSDPASALALWRTVYNNPLTLNEGGFAGSTIVQRIDAAHLMGVGSQSKVRITLRGSLAAAAADLIINKVTISQAAVAPEQLWNSIAPITQLRFGNKFDVTIPATTTKLSDKADYILVAGKDLIIAFDITSGPLGKLAPFAGPNMYSKPNVTEAVVTIPPNRTAGYTAHNNSVYIVEKIEVL